jgi:hypothetical protein
MELCAKYTALNRAKKALDITAFVLKPEIANYSHKETRITLKPLSSFSGPLYAQSYHTAIKTIKHLKPFKIRYGQGSTAYIHYADSEVRWFDDTHAEIIIYHETPRGR